MNYFPVSLLFLLSASSRHLAQGQDDDEEGSYEIKQNWQKVNLEEHNKLRRKHGVPDLIQDEQLNRVAQKYAEHLAAYNLFNHSTNDLGENLMQTSADSEEEAVREAVANWYEEIKDYNYKSPGYREETSHFTTMVWKGTTHVGVGLAYNQKEDQYVVVANYRPGGNVDGEYRFNVLPAVE